MSRDFTLKVYREFLQIAIDNGYQLTSYEDYIKNKGACNKVIILRQDVDKLPDNSLKTAQLQKELGVKSSYYFRIVPESFHVNIIEQIVDLGHEIGYHYEDLALFKGDFDKAIASFETNLERFKKYYPIKTICMHGSPLSTWDNRLIWEKYNYREFGIIGEPYFDLDFNKVLYITDTGRKWNGSSVSIRDKVNSSFNYNLRSTFDIIAALQDGILPDLIMQNIHPQRWSDNYYYWTRELCVQNIKNVIKKLIVQYRS